MIEDWIDKVSLKKRWGIRETELIEIVYKRILIPHALFEGQYYPMPFTVEKIRVREEYGTHRWGTPVPVKVKYREDIPVTKDQIAEGLQRCLWFRKIAIEDAEYEGRIQLPERTAEETKPTTTSDAGKIGGKMKKKSLVLMEVMRKFLAEDGTMIDWSDSAIATKFSRKYNRESRACIVKVNGKSWKVYACEGRIWSESGDKEEKAIKISSLRSYIAIVRKEIKIDAIA